MKCFILILQCRLIISILCYLSRCSAQEEKIKLLEGVLKKEVKTKEQREKELADVRTYVYFEIHSVVNQQNLGYEKKTFNVYFKIVLFCSKSGKSKKNWSSCRYLILSLLG